MIADDFRLIEQLFKTHGANVLAAVRNENAALHARLDVAHDKLNTTLSALSHLVQRMHAMTTVSDLAGDVVTLEGDVDQLLAKYDQAKADQEAADNDAADKIRTSLQSIMTKVTARLGGSDASTGSTSGTQQSGSDQAAASAPSTTVGTDATTATTADGSTTTVDHTTGQASTTDASGAPVVTDEAAAQAARDAAAAQGVSVPAA